MEPETVPGTDKFAEEFPMLVARAQGGDATAFDELVQKFRERALRFAARWVRDAHTAEDIVQESWIRAYTQIRSLSRPDRFWPWFRRIIYHQSMGMLRRGGPYRYECPISGMADNPDFASDAQEYLLYAARDDRGLADDPTAHLIRLEDQKHIQRAMKSCLNARERMILQAHWQADVPLVDLSRKYAMSMSNAYQIVSRSRLKLRKHLLQSAVVDYIEVRKQQAGHMNNRVEPYAFAGEFWSTAAFFLAFALHHSKKGARYSIPEMMALSGHAFVLRIKQNEVDLSGTFAYDWGEHFIQGLYNLGFQARYVGGYGCKQPLPYKLVEAIHLIHSTIDNGVPAIIWAANAPFFSLVTSYRDESSTLQVFGLEGRRTIPYEELGKGAYANLFALSVGQEVQVERRTALKLALQMAVSHARGEDGHLDGYTHGLQAYDAWMEALLQQRVDVAGNAYNAAVLAEARTNAAEFLRTAAHRWLPAHLRTDRIRRMLAVAAERYQRVTVSVGALRKLFPFPNFGDPHDPQAIAAAVALLSRARSEETAAVHILERLVNAL